MYVVTTASLTQVEASPTCGCYAWLAIATPCRSLQLARSAPARRQLLDSVALKLVVPSSLVIARAFNWHISLVTAYLYCLLSSTYSHGLFSSSGCLALWPRNDQQLLLSKSHFFFFLRSHHTFFPLHGFQCFLLLQLS